MVPGAVVGNDPRLERWIDAVSRDLQQHRGRCAVVPGAHASADVHVLAHALNAALGNIGTTVLHSDPVEAEPIDQMQSLRALADDMRAGRVEVLCILGRNPVYDAPADVDVASLLRNPAVTSIQVSSRHDQPAAAWPVAWTNTVPSNLFISTPVLSPLSNAPTLFLHAQEN